MVVFCLDYITCTLCGFWGCFIIKAAPFSRLILFVKVWTNMKSYYDFMLFRTVCSSFKGFKSMWPKYWKKTQEEIAGNLSDPQK